MQDYATHLFFACFGCRVHTVSRRHATDLIAPDNFTPLPSQLRHPDIFAHRSGGRKQVTFCLSGHEEVAVSVGRYGGAPVVRAMRTQFPARKDDRMIDRSVRQSKDYERAGNRPGGCTLTGHTQPVQPQSALNTLVRFDQQHPRAFLVASVLDADGAIGSPS